MAGGARGVTQPRHGLAWPGCASSVTDKAERLFGPEPLADLSAHHAPFPSLVTLGRLPFPLRRAGGMQGSCKSLKAVG